VHTSKESWYEADIHCVAGELALMGPRPDAAKAQSHFERALAVARAQQAKSWELRAAMSLARFWRDRANRGKRASYWIRPTAGSPRGSTRAI
jgi:predicted ATPase